ncbi:phospho-sugar mutase [Aeromicrobium sp. 636]|uniref:Phospho-sugar mutase n=1 Tax=Aeromicrobium senzhongii TaxID=2663859 RepID=A0A8I0K2E8_9ACTN|nr:MULTISPECIES: phospho-sugar mutase [Aeromicrobium]MBC9226239.1 phospho-sugar mutase [Aeromicrobium senzhongii]MCQ3998345.1 phospho-sugar mutase [Aeromicrobium sp. 636]
MDPIDAARDWISQDPDPQTRDELTALIDSGDTTEIAVRFAGRLQFGTAGLRGELGAGPMRMNRVTVARAAAGLAQHLLETAPEPSVVIGYDARTNSDVFARDTAEIMQAMGVRALLLPEYLPTPVLAFAIGHLGASAGVMVTASHNPPRDNGYKVYLADTSQIVPPIDGQIAACIDAVGRVDELPRDPGYTVLGTDVAEAYLDAVAALVPDGPRELVVAYTPMHGVGGRLMTAVAERAGFAVPHVVEAQAHPDPSFPTVAFPNPEEPGAMDLALELAASVDADVIIANDPDADRCAVGVRTDGGHRMLTGDQVGALLAESLLSRGVVGTYACSIVSSDLLGRQAAAHHQPWQQTLTGFKWIGKVEGLVFGYEEALGYCVAPHIARDKDGMSAAVLIMALAASLKAEGRTLIDLLDDIYRRHGWHATGQLAVRVDDLALIATAMQRLRTDPPATLAGVAVTSLDDLEQGYQGLPPTDGIRLGLQGGSRIICRPSGTEPKLKCYVEAVTAVGDSLDTARAAAAATVDAIIADLSAYLGLA